ncbi:MAG TPA: fused response regulator/phosphatase [Spirochaetota bacterium]|nr:fused response regulator/phosphatase [Spirochaetota bacterium]HPS86178.1 fused response regulator/phosphatase [Spirochaetota bacterium]
MKKRILLIDDEAPVRDFMKKILVRSGYVVFTASDGKEAIDMLETLYVDLIILDMHMPNMNGLDVLRHIRKNELTNKPVLMVSGYHDADLRIESYRLGAYDFITKPEQTEVMLKRIENGIKIGEILDFNEFMKVELFMAKKLQKYIFPEPEYISDDLDIYSWNLPLSDIGGDLYDYIHFRNDSLLIFIADVSGHSISASMFTAIVKMVFRNAIKNSENPGDIMTIVNNELAANLPVESFVTMFCCLIDSKTGEIKYSNAGHPKPYIIGKDRITELIENDPFLGPIKDMKYSTYNTVLNKDESLFLYTDGLLDIIDDEYHQVDLNRFIGKLTGKDFINRESFNELTADVSNQRLIRSDDCTVMVIRKK